MLFLKVSGRNVLTALRDARPPVNLRRSKWDVSNLNYNSTRLWTAVPGTFGQRRIEGGFF